MEQKDQLLHITLMDGRVRGLLLTATRTVAEAIRHVSHSAASRPGTPVSISVCKKELCM